jgi:mono/diheme cytochrome c family protein
MKPTELPTTADPRSCRAKSLCFAMVLALSAIAPAWADEQETIEWTRHSVQVTPETPRGYAEFQNSCAVCHGPMPERPGTRALAAKYKGSLPAMLEDRRDLSPELIRAAVRNGITVMPHFRKTELSDAQLDAIVAYLTRSRP